MGIIDDIQSIKREKNALLLTHNYQHPEIQDPADNVGDSIRLGRHAMQEKDAEILVFAVMVDFMAESATSLYPNKKVLLPTLGSRCPMVQMLLAEQVVSTKQTHPDVPVVLYVNTLAEAEAECDVGCTSANAVPETTARKACRSRERMFSLTAG